MRTAAGIVLPLLAAATSPPSGEVVVELSGLRSSQGQVLVCLTASPRSFPDCSKDANSRRVAIAADRATVRLSAVPPGTYAVSVLHDENGNGRADKALLVPREGFGFSRDAPVRFGPPKFAQAAFVVTDRTVSIPITMRYLF